MTVYRPVPEIIPERIPLRMTNQHYADFIDRWNRFRPHERQARITECRERGHDWRITPFSTPIVVTSVCIRCCRYDDADVDVD